MKDEYEVIIVGGGLHGLGIAYNLARRGLNDVVVFERGYLGCGASFRNACFIRASHNGKECGLFLKDTFKILEHLVSELKFNILLRKSGYLMLLYTEEEVKVWKEGISIHRSYGHKSRFLSHKEVKEMIPSINLDGVSEILFLPEAGTARPEALVWAFAKGAKELGVEIYPFTEVRSIRVKDNNVSSVTTTRGEVKTNIVVNAAGGYAREVARMVGIELPVSPRREEALVTEPLKRFIDPMIAIPHLHLYMGQTARGEIIASTECEKKESHNIKSTFNFLEKISRSILRVFPVLKNVKVLRQWAGTVTVSPDGCPLLGETEIKGFFVDCSGSSNGFVTCVASAKYMADLIIDGKCPIIESFSPQRFKKGKLIREPTIMSHPEVGLGKFENY